MNIFIIQKESLENIFKNNKSVIESQVTKLPVKIISPQGELINNQNKMTASTNNYQSPVRNGGFESGNGRQNVIPVDLKGQQDPNLKYQNINNSTAFLSQKLQEKEDQLHNIQREAEKYNQSIQKITTHDLRTTPNGHTVGETSKGGKSKVLKAVAIGVFMGIVFTLIQNIFTSNIEAINPLNL